MATSNREIAETFANIADLLQIRGDVIHRVLSYRRAAETIRDLPRDLRAVAAEGSLTDLPHIGHTLADKIGELLATGEMEFYQRLTEEIPSTLVEVVRVNGVGPKKARLFMEELGVTSLEALQEAAESGLLRDLKGMGAKSEAHILAGIESLAKRSGRALLGKALPAAQELLDTLLALPRVQRGFITGSIRRACPTIGDVDLLVASGDPASALEACAQLPRVARVLDRAPDRIVVELHDGLQVDLRALEGARMGTALACLTGSQAHNTRLRERARRHGFSLNEYALCPLKDDGTPDESETGQLLFAEEEALYEHLGLPWIPPELREDRGEFEAAQDSALPELVTLADIRTDLHMHTAWSDGRQGMREMAEAARRRGCHTIVITDHSQYSAIANGLDTERLLAQAEEVRAVDAATGPGLRVLHGVEMDIRADGALDLPDQVLARLDFVIASLHYGLRQERAVITRRLLNAIENPHVDLIGHPRGQLLERRDGAGLDMDAVFAAAARHGIALEINANPARLDLEAQYARRASEHGIPLAINSDAHDEAQLDRIHYGVRTARRAWAQAEDVLNTWPRESLLAWMRARGR